MRIFYVSGFIVLVDQITKLMVKGIKIPLLGISVEGMIYGSSIPIIGDFLRLTYIENPGMAFGIDLGGKLFFSLFSIIATFAIAFYLYKSRSDSFGFRLSLAMILGGAVGNLIDRVFYSAIFEQGALFYGKVVDFVDVEFFDLNIFGYSLSRWPVFNVADACVTVGIVLMFIFHKPVKEKQNDLRSAIESSDVLPTITLEKKSHKSAQSREATLQNKLRPETEQPS